MKKIITTIREEIVTMLQVLTEEKASSCAIHTISLILDDIDKNDIVGLINRLYEEENAIKKYRPRIIGTPIPQNIINWFIKQCKATASIINDREMEKLDAYIVFFKTMNYNSVVYIRNHKEVYSELKQGLLKSLYNNTN